MKYDYLLKYRTHTEPLSIEELERNSLEAMINENIRNGNTRIPEVPFGFAQGEWNAFKSKILDGDKLYRAEEIIDKLCAWIGILIVRTIDGKETVVDTFTLWVS